MKDPETIEIPAQRSDKSPRSSDGEATADRLSAQASRLCRDLYRYRAPIYFADFLCSAAVGYGATWRYLSVPDFSIEQICLLLIAALALFRAGVFIHEIAHMQKDSMKLFKAVWNIVFGIPMLMPSFMYKNHVDHHGWRTYGTARDGEYQPFAHGSFRQIVQYFLQVPVVPAFGIVRFAILTPASLFSARIRRWVLAHASSYISNPRYVRHLPAHEDRRWWLVAELACAVLIYVAGAALLSGWLHWSVAVEIYLLSTIGVALNWIRNLAGHRFRSSGASMSFAAQITESVSIVGTPWLHELLFPVGMRYHAVHHMLPGLPYHNLPEAHRRLTAALPAQSVYHKTVYSSLWQVYRCLFDDIRNARRGYGAGSRAIAD